MKNTFEFVQTAPKETVLLEKGIRDCADAWVEMIDSAKKTIDIGQFYINDEKDQAMEPVLKSIVAAGKRGVKVRVVLDKMMSGFYPKGGQYLAKQKNVQVRYINVSELTGGIMHAKYIIVDKEKVYLGSHNFDWLSLTHVYEIGFIADNKAFAKDYTTVFENDWDLAKTNKLKKYRNTKAKQKQYKVVYEGKKIGLTPVFSPPDLTPSSVVQELPVIVDMMKNANFSVLMTAMEYTPKSQYHPKLYSDALDATIREIAAKGVNVKLLVGDWCHKSPNIDYLKSLSFAPNVEVKIMTIPRCENEYLPFSRVTHCKYIIIDKTKMWMGSSNFEVDYFFNSRNCSAIIDGSEPTVRMRQMFLNAWTSPYAAWVDPTKDYIMPQIMD